MGDGRVQYPLGDTMEKNDRGVGHHASFGQEGIPWVSRCVCTFRILNRNNRIESLVHVQHSATNRVLGPGGCNKDIARGEGSILDSARRSG